VDLLGRIILAAMEALDLDAVELGRTEGAPNPRGLRSLAQIPCSLVLIREALDQSGCSRCLVRMSTNAMSTDPFRAKFFIPSRAGTVHFVGSYSGHKSAKCGPLEPAAKSTYDSK